MEFEIGWPRLDLHQNGGWSFTVCDISKQGNFTKPLFLSFINSAYPTCRASNRTAGMWGRLLPHLACLLLNKQDFLHPGGSAGREPTCNAGDLGLTPELRRSPGKGIGHPLQYSWASPVAQTVKYLPAMRKTWIWALAWEDPLEKAKVTHSSILAWRIPWTHGVSKSQTQLSNFHFYFLPEAELTWLPLPLNDLQLFWNVSMGAGLNSFSSGNKQKNNGDC